MWSQGIGAVLTAGAGCTCLLLLLDAAAKGLVVLGLAAVATLMMRRSAAAARHLVWCLAVASLPVLPVLSAVAPGWHVLPQWMLPSADLTGEVSAAENPETLAPSATATATRQNGNAANPGSRPFVPARSPVGLPATVPTSISTAEPPEPIQPVAAAQPSPPATGVAESPESAASREALWTAWVLLAWSAGAIAVLAPMCLGMLSLWWLQRSAERVTDGPWLSQLQDLSGQLGIRRRTILLQSDRRCMPMHWGIWRAKLLLPAAADGWTEQRLRVVLLHELAHVKRRDCLAQLIARLACAVYWFNPLVWVALWRMRVESETACDDLILRSGYRGADYAGHLLEIVAGSQAGPLATCGSIAMARRSGLEGRLLAILDGRRNRRAPTRAAVLLTVAMLAAVVVPVAMMRAAGDRGPGISGQGPAAVAEATLGAERPGQAAAAYDHFLYLRHNPVNGVAKTTTLVLAEVTPEGFQQRDVFEHNNLHIGWEPICAVQGRVYALKIGDLIAIDVASGTATLVCPYVASHTYDSGRLYAMVHVQGQGSVLRVFDFGNQTYRDVCGVGDEHWDPPLALSPERKRLAHFAGRDNMMSPSSFQLEVIDLASGESKAVGPTIRSMVFITGGGDATDGPPFIWLDDKTILLVRDEAPAGDGAGQVPFAMMGGGPSEPLLATLDLDTGQMTDVLRLPRFTRRLLEPFLRPLGSDGVPRVVVGELGQYRVDLKTKQLAEDNTVVGQYGWSRGRKPERLLFGQTELSQADSIPELAVSPDGRQVVWLSKRNELGAELYYHAAGEKAARVVAQGWFPTAWEAHRRPEDTVILWAGAKDVVPAAPAGPPKPPAEPPKPQVESKPFPVDPWPEPPKPRVDLRPDVSDCFTLTLSADKTTYRHHEPVRLAVTLGNKTDRQLSFKSPTGFDAPIRLTRKSPRSSGLVDLLRDTVPAPPDESGGSGTADAGRLPEEVFAENEVTLGPWENLRFVRLLELSDLGQHTIEGTFRLGSGDWRGSVDAQPITLQVQPSAEEGPLLEAKFERLMALCRQEFEADPMTCRYSRIYDLGPPAVPLLVAALEASGDAKFRQRMGFALASMATADALPYFERLLAGNMQDDRRMVLDGLSNMIERSRSAGEALGLLLSALKHANPTVRRDAAERLRPICAPQVASAMQSAVGDSDRETSLMAARYLAAYEWLDLAGWLALAAEQPTQARYVAAGQIIEQLQREWHQDLGRLPGKVWEDLAEDPVQQAAYKAVLQAWEQWARGNRRSSEHFFDDDRKGWPERQPQPAPNPADDQGSGRQLAPLIEQLGDEDFARREAAQQELARIGVPAREALAAAAAHPDPEIASRARIALASINRQIETDRQAHRQAAAAAVERSDKVAAGQHYLALLALPDPPLKDCRDASRFFEGAEDWPLYAVAREATAREMKRVIATPIEEFTRPAPEPIDPNAPREGGPVVEVQTQLDGQWSLGRGTAADWTDWLKRKQDQMGPERIDLLLALARLYRDRLGQPARAVAAYSELLAGVPLFVDPLDDVIARHWPVRSGELKENWGTIGGSYLQAMDELAAVQQAAGDLPGAINTKTRQLLAQFNLAWNFRDGLVDRSAEQLCGLLRMLPADAPLPPLFWLNVLSPERDTITLDLRRPRTQGVGSELYDPNVMARPGYVFDTLQVTAEVASRGRDGMLACYTVLGSHTTLGTLRWDAAAEPGRRIDGTVKVPEEATLIRFEAFPQEEQELQISQVTVKATFRPSQPRSDYAPGTPAR